MTTTAEAMVHEAMARIDSVSAADAHEAASGEVTFLDVREPVEWERHIEGAIQIPRGVLESMADPGSPRYRADLGDAARLVVCCRSGHRSALATSTLVDLGYTNASNLAGGLNGWIEEGLPVVEHHDGM